MTKLGPNSVLKFFRTCYTQSIVASNTNAVFNQEVTRLRADYQRKRDATNLFPPAGQPFEDGGRYVRLSHISGALSGDILRIERNLPSIEGHFEIAGDVVCILEQCPDHPPLIDDDFEDVSDLVARLPLINVDPSKHFLKKGKYRSEIESLLRCQGGSCPGTVLSERLIPGFGKLRTRAVLASFSSLNIYRRWILDIIDGLACLHSLGILHRDLRIDNCLLTEDDRPVVCDIEGLPWPVPQPLQAAVDACMPEMPNDRPTLVQLREKVENIRED
ncbi:hypothetical protein B0H63DRAFT_498613 [Podospora didyma]|uniref:non-specific serine/threonine protein kinase n=1 Tax=Podospora didyma TaxID=330526 RepID=A0AAE0U7L5_9PEZI|nr:hypothetical protein B0H63DRAFT_498613 [Podospora didyma]